jgi:hypothetical protein
MAIFAIVIGMVILAARVFLRINRQMKSDPSPSPITGDGRGIDQLSRAKAFALSYHPVFNLHLSQGQRVQSSPLAVADSQSVTRDSELVDLYFQWAGFQRGLLPFECEEMFMTKTRKALWVIGGQGSSRLELDAFLAKLKEFHRMYFQHLRGSIPFGQGEFFRLQPRLITELFYSGQVPQAWLREEFEPKIDQWPGDFQCYILQEYTHDPPPAVLMNIIPHLDGVDRETLIQVLEHLSGHFSAEVYQAFWDLLPKLSRACAKTLLIRLVRQPWADHKAQVLFDWVLEDKTLRSKVLPVLLKWDDPRAWAFLVANRKIPAVGEVIRDRLEGQEGVISLAEEEGGELSEG